MNLLNDTRVRVDVLATFAIKGSKTFADEIGVDTGQRVIGSSVSRVQETKVEKGALFLVDIRDELAAFAELAEAIDGFGVVFALWAKEFYEAVELLAVVVVGTRSLTLVEHPALGLGVRGTWDPGV